MHTVVIVMFLHNSSLDLITKSTALKSDFKNRLKGNYQKETNKQKLKKTVTLSQFLTNIPKYLFLYLIKKKKVKPFLKLNF